MCRCVLSCFSPVWLFATLWTIACSSVHGILQARILEKVAHALLHGIFPTQESNPVSHMILNCRRVCTYGATWEAPPALVGGFFTTSTTREVHMPFLLCFNFLKASQPLDYHLMVYYYFVINLKFIYSTWDIYYDRKNTFLPTPFFSLNQS